VDWVERVTKLRRFTRGDERAAHKPLLLPYALGRFQRYGDAPIGFSEAEAALAGLLKKFGPPRKTSPVTISTGTVSAGASPGARGDVRPCRAMSAARSPSVASAGSRRTVKPELGA
jgi:putative restriction endonuclease